MTAAATLDDLAPVRSDLAPSGTLRATINFGNTVLAQKDPKTGEPRGVSVVLATELARRLCIPIAFTTFEAAGKAFAALKAGEVDIAFLALEPERAAEVAFTAPYVVIEGTYLVRDDSPLKMIDDFDRPGIRIAVGLNAAYDLFLTRTLRNAELVRAPTSSGAVDLFLSEGLEAAAGVRQPLEETAQARDRLRVVDGRFTSINQAMCMIPGRNTGMRYLAAFVEDAKASGLVSLGLVQSEQDGDLVAPRSDASCSSSQVM